MTKYFSAKDHRHKFKETAEHETGLKKKKSPSAILQWFIKFEHKENNMESAHIKKIHEHQKNRLPVTFQQKPWYKRIININWF